MICPNCNRDTKTVTTQGVLRYRNRYGKEIPVPWWGEWCKECGHKFHTLEQEEMHSREKEERMKKSEEPK
jgi:hypothetical protein